jgi:hypothetical protein
VTLINIFILLSFLSNWLSLFFDTIFLLNRWLLGLFLIFKRKLLETHIYIIIFISFPIITYLLLLRFFIRFHWYFIFIQIALKWQIFHFFLIWFLHNFYYLIRVFFHNEVFQIVIDLFLRYPDMIIIFDAVSYLWYFILCKWNIYFICFYWESFDLGVFLLIFIK